MNDRPRTALVLSGGGARAAYQVGVLRAIAQLRQEARSHASALSSSSGTSFPAFDPRTSHGAAARAPRTPDARGLSDARRTSQPTDNPFDIIVGTSAGAINSAALACRADRFGKAVDMLCHVWENFSAEHVYRADSLGVIRNGARWATMLSLGWALARWRRIRPRSLLDNAPLAELLQHWIPMQRIPLMLERGHLRALAITASSYGTGQHVTFYDACEPIEPWARSQRQAVATRIDHAHLLASSAIPFIFPAASLRQAGHDVWFGDGSMRQTAPLAPAIHLGAQRMLVIGAGRLQEPEVERAPERRYPSIAQIAGHALSNIFLDALAVDVERMARINHTLSLLPRDALEQTPLRPIEFLMIAPSERLDDIATRHIDALPRPIRALLRGAGVGKAGPRAQGGALASYLLFEAPYTCELMALGERDAMHRAADIRAFFGWDAPQASSTAVESADDADLVQPMSYFSA
ncbi:patatin-like phospholipase family protein [Pararobbsia silviterrae]|uniref:Patatin-like phospholipase family protein n=1 Tax=Pararobbsia silviterrae TaxID=1792498 RepID=A0A494XMF8_9BURK|nr:patatin-like phospholipase family protein [Pararobbsia silviterrae]RKP51808.1 patatin-like phospholipase family protein [Pararobbsia silviterrae]